MRVVLDSTAIIQNYRMDSTRFRLLFDSISSFGLRVFVPQIVVDEVVNHFKSDLVEKRGKAVTALNDLRRLLGSEAPSLSDLDTVEESVAAYRTMLLSRLSQAGVTILPLPSISLEDVFQRSLARKRPFRRVSV